MAKSATISGLTITIGADTKQFSDAIKQLDAEARNIAKDLKAVNDSLKLDPTNLSKSVTSLKLLEEQSQKAGEKVKLIQDSINKLNKEYANGKVTSADYTKSMDHLQILLSQATHEQDLINEEIRQFGVEAEEAGKGAISLGDIIKGNLISDLIQTGLKKVVDLAKSLGSAIWGAVKDVASATWNFTKDSVKIAEENKQTLAKVKQVYGEYAQSVIDWSKSAVDAMGLTSGQAQASAVTLGNMFTALGITEEEASKMSMELVQLAADVGAFNNVTTTEVLDKFASGLAGNSRQLRELGIVINASLVEEKALQLGLAESSDELTEADKAVARYALMLEQGAKQSGQFARESDSVTVQTQKLRAKIGELQGEIGDKLLPIQAKFYKELNDFLDSEAGKKLFEEITKAVGDLADKVIELVEDGRLEEWIGDIKEKVPDIVSSIDDFAGQVMDLLPKVADLVEQLLAFFGIETEAQTFKRETKEALSEVTDELDRLAKSYATDTDTIRTAIAMFAEEHGTTVKDIYEDWETYEPQITEYLSGLKESYSTDLIDGSYSILKDFADKNLISLEDIYNNWGYWMPQIILYAQDLGDGYDKKFSEAWSYLQLFAERNGTSLGDVLENWEVYEPQIKTWYDTFSEQTEGMEKAVDDALAKMPEDAQQSVNDFASIDYTAMDSFRERVRGWAHSIIGWFTDVKNLSQNPDYITDSSLTEQSTPDWMYGEGAWNPYDPFRAFGGPVSAGHLYRVNDDAGRRSEWFVPSQNGYILNGNQTDRIVNNSSSQNFSGGIQIYVNSYGMNVAEVADELGAAFQQKIRMSGAML